ncbi:hypothetical protein Kisp01_27450 [Kineosporia sp. NBRC 101677]|nr:hypothetical protein Kisp01_27450 [Kineosporia sp. NBRC 101677]
MKETQAVLPESVAQKVRGTPMKVYAGFMGGQSLIQAISLVVGIIVVNQLSKAEYSYYTIAFTVVSAITVLGNSGFSSAILSRGAKLRSDRHELSRLVLSIISLRRRVFVIVVMIVGPLTWILLRRNGASTHTTLTLVSLVMLTSAAMTSFTVFNDLLALEYERARLQVVSISGAFLRLAGAVWLLAWPMKAAAVPVAVNAMVIFLSIRMQKTSVRKLIDLRAPTKNQFRQLAMRNFAKLLPVNLFVVLQGQVIVFYLGVLGQTETLAEVGALGRFSTAFAVISVSMSMLAGPIVARASTERVAITYFGILSCAIPLIFVLVACVSALSPHLLPLLGTQYSGLEAELRVMFAAGAIICVGEVLRTLNQARGWIGLSWLQIPITILAIGSGVALLDMSSAMGACVFSVVVSAPAPTCQLIQMTVGMKNRQRTDQLALAEGRA